MRNSPDGMEADRLTLDLSRANAWFVRNYADCRDGFLQKAARFEAVASHREWPADVASEPSLVTDTLWLGAADAKRVLVLISATHGVEGYCGSAVQQFLLSQWSPGTVQAWQDTAVLFIHALNPWGMAHARRCDAQGIDLNRNFLDFSAALPADPDYPELLAALALADVDQRTRQLTVLRERWGERRFQQVLSSGQALCDWAPFYCGTAPSRASQVIDTIIAEYQLSERELVVLDLHSGLGPWSHGELICDHPADSNGQRYAVSLFGKAVANAGQGESFSVPLNGLQDYRWHALMAERGCFLTLEYGSYPVEHLFRVLLDDHLYWHQLGKNAADTPQRLAMLEHFCPQDVLWQQAVLFRGWQYVSRVLEYFGNE